MFGEHNPRNSNYARSIDSGWHHTVTDENGCSDMISGHGRGEGQVAAGHCLAEAENVGAPINSAESDQDPFIAPDGSYLIICLTGRDDSVGKYDLYVSFAKDDGAWSEPVSLGQSVNTPGSEFRPYVSRDGKYLFFTSLAPAGETGSRIFWVSTEVIETARGKATAD